MNTIRLVPSTYSVSSSYLSVSNASNMYTNTDSSTYATITNTRSGTTSYYIYIKGFNFEDIPNDATIVSFSIKLKARESGIYSNSSYAPKLCNNTSQLTSTCSAITTTVNTYTFSGYSIDVDDMKAYGDDFGIRINCRRNSRNTTGYMYIYGAEIEINYTTPSDKIYTKINGSWVEASTLYVKNNGVWVQIDSAYLKENGSWVQKDKSAIFDNRRRFIKS